MFILKPKNQLFKKFAFTKREFNALLFLLLILIALFTAPFFLPGHEASRLSTGQQLAIKQLQLAEKQQAQQFTRSTYRNFSKKPSPVYFKFDPNTATATDWEKMGLSPKQAKVIPNYVAKGGRFYQPEDLQKMFVISPDKYQSLLPYVQIAHINPKFTPAKTFENAPRKTVIVELNTADTAQLDLLKGIGPAFARRIVKYREKLGGFYRMEQLMEVYQLDSAIYQTVAPQLTLNIAPIKKININTATFEQLKNHPYLRYKQINAIINYRKQHGHYQNATDLAKVAILDKATIDKMLPYLDFDATR